MNYAKDVLLSFTDGSSNSTDDAFVAKASDFLGMEIAGTTTVKLSFRGGQDRDSVNTATLTVDNLEAAHDGTGSGLSFRDISEVVASLLNGNPNKVIVVADQEAGTYVAPFSGAVTIANAVD
mgnify:FL=1|tara:strand:+ start:55 stop:420 length:366 start_codon:yes stop_codon:yes gene_type:complete